MIGDDADEWEGTVCFPGDTPCGAVWWSRLARAVGRDPRGWAVHACIFGGSFVTILCCLLYAGEYLGRTATILVALCDALQCVAYYVWHWNVVWRSCFASSVPWYDKMTAILLYAVAIGLKLATPWLVAFETDRTSAVGAAAGAYIFHWSMYAVTQLTVRYERRGSKSRNGKTCV